MDWINPKDHLPEPLEEVLICVDGHRTPMWSNNYQLVAYLTDNKFLEERHPDSESIPVEIVLGWKPLDPNPPYKP